MPVSVERALTRVRTVTAVIVAIRLLAAGGRDVSLASIGAIAGAFIALNAVSLLAQRHAADVRRTLGVVQLAGDVAIVLTVVSLRPDGDASVDWALLVWPVLEGAIRFGLTGFVSTWAAVAAGYTAWHRLSDDALSYSTLAQRLVVVALVGLPSAFLAQNLVKEMAAHRRGVEESDRRGGLLKAAALGGRRSTSLDVDEILDVLRETIGQMGFADPLVFEIEGTTGTPSVLARPVRHSKDVLAVPPGDPRLLVAARARDTGGVATWPPDAASRAGALRNSRGAV